MNKPHKDIDDMIEKTTSFCLDMIYDDYYFLLKKNYFKRVKGIILCA